MFTVIAFAIALFFAMNIGASGSAATMGIAYGSGAVKSRKTALWISAVGIFLGATIGGGEVIKTIGSGLIPSSILTVQIVIIIIASATLTLFSANRLGIPLSTSEVTVGSIVGVGLAYGSVFFEKLSTVVLLWLLVPFVAFVLAFLFGKMIIWCERHFPILNHKKMRKYFVPLVLLAGFFEAVSAGMNNVANAVGPLVGSGFLTVQSGMLLGGIFVASGAVLMGGKVIETNGKKITSLSLLQGATVSGTSAMLVMTASFFGIPVPMTQITTTGILGIGMSEYGIKIFKKSILKKIVTVWVMSPIFSLVISYSFVKIFMRLN